MCETSGGVGEGSGGVRLRGGGVGEGPLMLILLAAATSCCINAAWSLSADRCEDVRDDTLVESYSHDSHQASSLTIVMADWRRHG